MGKLSQSCWTDKACDQVMEERRAEDGTLRPIPEKRVEEIFAQHRPPESKIIAKLATK